MRKLLLSLVLILNFSLISCNSSQSERKKARTSYSEQYLAKLETVFLKIKNVELKTYLALNDQQQTHGLSSIKPEFFTNKDAMIFFNPTTAPRSFWMPDTHFNLDIFFVDENLIVKGIDRNAPHHPGLKEPPAIYRTGYYECRHVIELKHSDFSKSIKVGDQFSWKDAQDLPRIESQIRLQQ